MTQCPYPFAGPTTFVISPHPLAPVHRAADSNPPALLSTLNTCMPSASCQQVIREMTGEQNGRGGAFCISRIILMDLHPRRAAASERRARPRESAGFRSDAKASRPLVGVNRLPRPCGSSIRRGRLRPALMVVGEQHRQTIFDA